MGETVVAPAAAAMEAENAGSSCAVGGFSTTGADPSEATQQTGGGLLTTSDVSQMTTTASMTPLEHPLRYFWQFSTRPRDNKGRRGGGNTLDWSSAFTTMGGVVTTVEAFWREMTELLRWSEGADPPNVFLFREGVQPAWEDPVFKSGGAVNISFSGTDVPENSRGAFLLACLLMIGSLFEPHDGEVHGVTLGSKGQNNSRLEIWLSTDSTDVMEHITRVLQSAIKDHHGEFFKILSTKVMFEYKVFASSGAGGRGKPKEETALYKIVHESS